MFQIVGAAWRNARLPKTVLALASIISLQCHIGLIINWRKQRDTLSECEWIEREGSGVLSHPGEGWDLGRNVFEFLSKMQGFCTFLLRKKLLLGRNRNRDGGLIDSL